MTQDVSRRDIFGIGAIAGGALATGTLWACSEAPKPAAAKEARETAKDVKTPAPSHEAAAPKPTLPWAYAKLDGEVVAERAYAGYWKGACCYGTFESVVGLLGDQKGAPYSTFPSEMMKVGEGGLNGWASLCGALNGAAMAAALLLTEEQRKVVVDELYTWYEQTELPGWTPKVSKNPSKDVANKAGSVLCHVSVGKWCSKANVKAFSKERSERCGRVTAAVAKKLVELMNAQVDGKFQRAALMTDQTKHCRSCHDKNGTIENTRGQMACGGCHIDAANVKSGHY